MTGFIYIGYNSRRIKNGVFKIGMTTRSPCIRANEIKHNGDTSFKQIGWIKVEDTHIVELLLLESIIRYLAWRDYNVKHFGNDHFAYNITKGEGKTQMFAIAIDLLNKTAQAGMTIISKKLNIEWA